MKKLYVVLLFILLNLSVFAKEKIDTETFNGFGRYIKTFEINDEAPIEQYDYDTFEQEAMEDVAKRYEENAVELKLDDDSYNSLNILNHERLFSLRINEDKL